MPEETHRKRIKLHTGLRFFYPVCYNFSDLITEGEDGEIMFDPTDNGNQTEILYNNEEYNSLIVQVLYNLTDTEKLIFLYQLLRDQGYAIDHGSFAKTLKITRAKYMALLSVVRSKSAFVIKGESVRERVREQTPTKKSTL